MITDDELALLKFVKENYGVVTIAEESGLFVCEMCGNKSNFADRIIHDDSKPCHILVPRGR